MKKRKLVLCSVLVLLLALAAAGTWAYFAAEAHVTNVITTGTIDITLNDSIVGGTTVTDLQGNVTGWKLENVMPGKEVEKTVSVSNDGTGDAWIRVILDTAITGADGELLPLTFTANGESQTAVIIGLDSQNWVAGENGCYYYKLPVAHGVTTAPLFSTVTLNMLLPNEYQGCVVNIGVSGQAVQMKNNCGTAGDITELNAENYGQILGWPEI